MPVDKQPPDYDDEEEDDTSLLPDGFEHEKFPVTKNDQKACNDLMRFFNNARPQF
jgi:hypothetical protein